MRFEVSVKDVMKKKLKTVNENDTIKKVAETMRKGRVGSVLVMHNRKLKGIITPSDIVYKHVAAGKGKKAKDIMTSKIASISPEKTIEDAAHMMVKNRIEKLPVFENGNIVGIITSNDILKIEPALVGILLERMKMGARIQEEPVNYAECEMCGNYSDDIEEVNGVYMCSKCRT